MTKGYRYDGDGKRYDRSTGGVVDTKYEWDQAAGLPELALERNATGAVTRRWVHGPTGPAWMSIPTRAFTEPDHFVYHRDQLGSVTDLTDMAGTSVASYTYEPFGQQIGTDPVGAPANPLRFTGEYLDPETQDYHLRARQYDPTMGRFTATDPVTPSMVRQWVSPYLYVEDRPGVLTDPSGEDPWARDAQRCEANGGMYCSPAYANAVNNLETTVSYGLGTFCSDYPNDARCQVAGDPMAALDAASLFVPGGALVKCIRGARSLVTAVRANRANKAAKAVRPTVSDPRLGRAVADDYRGGPNPIGDGSALDAARHTVKTGDLVGGSTHLEKVVEMRDRYARILRHGGLSSADEAVARSRYGAYRDFAREYDLDAMMKARGLR